MLELLVVNTRKQNIEQHKSGGGKLSTPRKGGRFLLQMWHLSCYSCYKPSDKSCIRKEPEYDYNKWSISVIIVTQILHNG